jgi:hypothetical protein
MLETLIFMDGGSIPQQSSDDGGINLGRGDCRELRHGPQVPEAGEVRCAAAGQPNRYDERASQQGVVLDLRLSTIGAVRGLDDVPVV